MYDVYFYEAFQEEAAELRHRLPPRYTAAYTEKTIQEAGHSTAPAKIVSVRTQSQIPLDWARQVAAILSRSTGYDHLRAYASKVPHAPALGYLPLYCHRAVAEQAMLLWMALLRRLPKQLRQFTTFHRDGLTGSECQGRTLVVVGVGNIGQEVIKIGRGLGMRVIGVDLDRRYAELEYLDIDSALPQADVLVCAMDLTAQNHGYFDRSKWQRIRRGALFINISRGELSPASALLAALEAGQLGGVGLDVYDKESLLAGALRSGQTVDDPEVRATLTLAQREDCICTPHNAFNSVEAVGRKSDHSVQQIVAFLDRGEFLWPVPECQAK